ncbi:MAG: hypothetical protein ACYSXF_02135 [Planctomycetota bacterium]|jgi:hypothetical protein
MSKWAMMSDFAVNLPDRPGELARLASMLREADVSLVGLWGYGPGQDKARFYCVPERAEQFRNFARSTGFGVEEGKTFYLTGADRPGVLVEWLDKIAAAGINLQAIEAVGIHGEFGCFIWADTKDHEQLKTILT